jgi:hypothetical protein
VLPGAFGDFEKEAPNPAQEDLEDTASFFGLFDLAFLEVSVSGSS